MKYMVVSDIHGSLFYARKVMDAFNKEQADKLIILGDLYYHGPRNPLPDEYDPMGLSRLLSEISDKLIVIAGNCDSEVDKMISSFPFHKHKMITVGKRRIFLTHGHKYNAAHFPPYEFDILMHGHFHVAGIEEVNGKIIVSVSSVSLPKNGSLRTYAIVNGDKIAMYDISGNLFQQIMI